ncbi:MAG: hypothetical protein IT355_11005 [Gemmatimonadaceae bacterium]|nr:hypothetical protein [Gemmatimonadaceae bacterium]
MRHTHAGAVLVVCAVALTACQDGPVAPRSGGAPMVSAAIGDCMGVLASRAPRSLDFPAYGLPTITVTASYPTGFGLPFDVMQAMRFPMGSGAERASCLNSPQVYYAAETLSVATSDFVPAPAGVDTEFWGSLSPRERRILLAKAEEYLRVFPDRYPTVGSVINQVFAEPILGNKARAKIRANDYALAPAESEQLAGGIYGCLLYRNFSSNPHWYLLNNETLRLVIDLVSAFAEAEFAWLPMRGLQFGRNGSFGAAMAASDHTTDCGTLVFSSIPGGRIRITDPYQQATGSTPGGAPPPAPEPGGGLPPGWYDY